MTQTQDFKHLCLKTYQIPRSPDDVNVLIHNIRSALPEPEIEILYTVYNQGQVKVKVKFMVMVKVNIRSRSRSRSNYRSWSWFFKFNVKVKCRIGQGLDKVDIYWSQDHISQIFRQDQFCVLGKNKLKFEVVERRNQLSVFKTWTAKSSVYIHLDSTQVFIGSAVNCL